MPDEKEPIPKFAARIKAKYPEYNDMDDTLLTQKILAKYPEYADMVDMSPLEPSKKKVGGEPSSDFFPASVSEVLSISIQGRKPKDEKNKFIKPLPVPISIDEGVRKDKKADSYWGGVWNTIVGGVGSAAGGVSDFINNQQEAFLDRYDRENGIPVGTSNAVRKRMKEKHGPNHPAMGGVDLPEGKIVENFINKARTASSSRENEEARSHLDITDGVSLDDVKALGFIAPKTAVDMAMGAATGGQSFFYQSVRDNNRELEESGMADVLTPNEKMLYLTFQGGVQAALEKFGLDKVLKSTGLSAKIKSKIANEIADELIKKGNKVTVDQVEKLAIQKASSLSSRIKSVGLKTATSFGYEGGTEGTQSIASDEIKLLTNKLKGTKIFDEDDIKANFFKNAINSAAVGGVFGGGAGGAVGVMSNTKKAVRKQVAKAVTKEDVQKVQQEINEQVEVGNITPQEAEAANITAQQYAEIASKIPEQIDSEKKYALIGGIQQREELQKAMEETQMEKDYVDPAFYEDYDSRLELLDAKLAQTNDYIDGIVSGKKPTYRKEGDTFIKTDAKGETEISKQHYELAVAIREEDAAKNKKPEVTPNEQKTFTFDHDEDVPQGLEDQKPIHITETQDGKIEATYSGEQLVKAGLANEVETPKLPGVYGDLYKSNPEAVLKDIAEQAQGFDASGNPLGGGSRRADMVKQGFSEEIIDEAVKKYPAAQPADVVPSGLQNDNIPEREYSVSKLDEGDGVAILNEGGKKVVNLEFLSDVVDESGGKWKDINIDSFDKGKGWSKYAYQEALKELKNRGYQGIISYDQLLQTPERSKAIRKYFDVTKSSDPKLVKSLNDQIEFLNKDAADFGEPQMELAKEVTLIKPKQQTTPKSQDQAEKSQVSESQQTTPKGEEQPSIRQRYLDDFNIVESSAFDWRVTSQLSTADRKKAVADIKNGKETAATRKLEQEIKDTIERGTVIINRGRGNAAQTVEIPVNDWFSLTPKEQEQAFQIADKADELTLSVIKDNDITLQNIDDFKHLFNGFPYDAKDFDITKDYLSGQGEGRNQANQSSGSGQIPEKATEKVAGVTSEGEGGGKLPPSVTASTVTEGGDNLSGITHADTAEVREKLGLPEYGGLKKDTHEGYISEAKSIIAKNPNAANEVMAKFHAGGKMTPLDNAILSEYKAALDYQLENNPRKEIFEKIQELIKVLEPAGSEAGKLLESRKLLSAKEDNLSNFLLDKQIAQGTELTDEQFKSETAKYEALKEAKEKLEKQLQEEREQHLKDIAELGLNKAKAKAKKAAKKSAEDYKKERQDALDAAREALRKLRSGEQGLQSAIPGFRELQAIAPHVKTFLQSLADQGVDKLDNMITQVHAEFKDVLEGLSKRQVLDILAGEHDEVKGQTRNEKANTVRLLKREAELIKELERARKGQEKAKGEKQTVVSNRRIDELKKKIKEVRDLNKVKEVEPVEDLTAGNSELMAKEEKRLQGRIDKLQKDLKEGNYLKEPEKKPVLTKSRKAQLMEDRVIDLENKIRHERSRDEYEKRSKLRKAFDKVMEFAGIRRLVQTALDMSTSFRQGATLISPRQIDVWLKGFQANLKSVFSPTKFERIMFSIRHDDQYHDMVKDGVVFNDLGAADPTLHNEDFRKSFVYQIPILREPLLASNRSADAFLNVSRYELYKKKRRQLERQGLTRESDPKAFSYMASWVMNMTGRGNMHSALEKPDMNAVLGNTFYGARLMASRFNLLNPITYFDPRVPKAAKIDAMKDMAAFTTTVMVAGLALAAAGGTISLDPDDPEFLQVRFGDKVYDISGGLATYIRTFLRIVKAGYTKTTGTKYEGKKATEKAGQSALNFFRNKLSPNTAYGVDAFFGKAYGQEFDPSEVYQIYPMYGDDAVKAFQDEGVTAVASVLLPNILGIGYGNYASKGQIDATLEDLLERNLRSDEMNSENIKNYKDKGRPVTYKEFVEYARRRDAEIEKDIKVLYETGVGKTPYKDLTPDQVKAETTYIKSHATTKVKEEMFGEQKKTHDEKREDKKLNKERDKKYNHN